MAFSTFQKKEACSTIAPPIREEVEMDTSAHRPLDLAMSQTGSSVVLELVGDLDIHTAPLLEAALRDLREDLYLEVILDLSELTFLDSTGLRAIISAEKAFRARYGGLRLVQGAPVVHRIFELTGTEGRFSWLPSNLSESA
jgi:anti-sigma B factor antagonist